MTSGSLGHLHTVDLLVSLLFLLLILQFLLIKALVKAALAAAATTTATIGIVLLTSLLFRAEIALAAESYSKCRRILAHR